MTRAFQNHSKQSIWTHGVRHAPKPTEGTTQLHRVPLQSGNQSLWQPSQVPPQDQRDYSNHTRPPLTPPSWAFSTGYVQCTISYFNKMRPLQALVSSSYIQVRFRPAVSRLYSRPILHVLVSSWARASLGLSRGLDQPVDICVLCFFQSK